MEITPQDKTFTNDEVYNLLIEFAITYIRSATKDIANDASEFLMDKLKEKCLPA